MKDQILAINPGGSSTKIGLFEGLDQVTAVWEETIRHSHQDVSRFDGVLEQLAWRHEMTLSRCQERQVEWGRLAASVGRGGPLAPMPGGVYRIGSEMIKAIHNREWQAEHPSILGMLIAHAVGEARSVPAFTVDPVCVDEMIDEARISGHPEITRRSLTHALSIRDTCRRAAAEMGMAYERANFVACHLGSGASVTAHRQGRMIDVNDSSGEGPFCTQRAGGLPVREVVKWTLNQRVELRAIDAILIRSSGLVAYAGTDDFSQLIQAIDQGDAKAKLLYDALIHQIKKEVGAYAATLDGRVDAILFSGGLVRAERMADDLAAALSWIAPVRVYPGEDELGALARGAARALTGKERIRTYQTRSRHEIQ